MENNDTNEEIQRLKNKLKDKNTEINILKKQVAEKDSTINEKDIEINNLKSQIIDKDKIIQSLENRNISSDSSDTNISKDGVEMVQIMKTKTNHSFPKYLDTNCIILVIKLTLIIIFFVDINNQNK